MSSSGLKSSDFHPPIVIDIGSDMVKYSQSVLNTYQIVKNIKAWKDYEEEERQEAHKESKKNQTNFMNVLEKTNQNNKLKKMMKKFQEVTNSKTKSEYNQRAPQMNNEEPKIETPIEYLYDDLEKMDEFDLNPNSVFDYNLFTDSFPTILGLIDCNEEDTDFFNKLKRYFNQDDIKKVLERPEISKFKDSTISLCKDYFNDAQAYEKNLFGFETIHRGKLIPDRIESWKNIVERIGELKFKKYNFLNHLYSETPLVFLQNTLPFEELKSQVKAMYEIAFEEYKCPYILIASSAMLNVYSQNLTSGIVVDSGESGTILSVVKNGFTDYNNSIDSSFLSGRNLTYLIALYLKNQIESKNEIPAFGENSLFDVNLEEYYQAKFLKESDIFSCYRPKSLPLNEFIPKVNYRNMPINTIDLSTLSYIYSFPEIYKYILSSKINEYNISPAKNFYQNLRKTFEFVQNNKDNLLFNHRDYFMGMNYKDFESKIVYQYLNQDFPSTEKKLITEDLSFVIDGELSKFRHNSISHMIFSMLEKLSSYDMMNVDKYTNIVFTGGNFNIKNFNKVVEQDVRSLVSKSDNERLSLNYSKCENSSMAFYKGANYISKIDDLSNIMVSRQEFFDYGAELLSYNYV